MSGAAPGRSGLLVSGGAFHDFGYVQARLATELQRLGHGTLTVLGGYPESPAQYTAHDFLVTYTCDLLPTAPALAALDGFVAGGGRWLALHASNAVLAAPVIAGGKWGTPNRYPEFFRLLGSRFLAHPPLHEFTVEPAGASHPLTRGIEAFRVTDELYVCEWFEPVDVLLTARFGGPCPAFDIGADVPAAEHPLMYTKPHGEGQVCVLTLSHANGAEPGRALHRGAWTSGMFRLLLSHALAWAAGLLSGDTGTERARA